MRFRLFLIGSLINLCLPPIPDSVLFFHQIPPPPQLLVLPSKIQDLLVFSVALLCVFAY